MIMLLYLNKKIGNIVVQEILLVQIAIGERIDELKFSWSLKWYKRTLNNIGLLIKRPNENNRSFKMSKFIFYFLNKSIT